MVSKSSFRWFFLTASFWAAIGLVFALPRFGNGSSPWVVVLRELVHWWSWGLLTPLIVAVDLRIMNTNRKIQIRSLAHLLLAPLFTVLYTYVVVIVDALLSLRPWSSVLNVFANDSVEGMFWSVIIYFLIVGVHRAYLFQGRYTAAELKSERLERAFTQARLNALRMQLDPHFLFNALNTISSQVEHEPRLARQMIGHLGDLLRVSLESNHRQEIPFQEELTFLGHYLAIQKTRFGDKLQIKIDVPSDLQNALVPNLFLQPLVENAIRHGISKRSSGGVITILARSVEDRLDIEILDDGIGLPPGWSEENATGVGLSSTRQRIIALNPPGSATFALHRREEGGTAVEISFPLRILKDDARVSSAA